MKRKNRFLIGLITSAITFGSLMAILGPKHFNRHGCHHSCEQFDQHSINKVEKSN